MAQWDTIGHYELGIVTMAYYGKNQNLLMWGSWSCYGSLSSLAGSSHPLVDLHWCYAVFPCVEVGRGSTSWVWVV